MNAFHNGAISPYKNVPDWWWLRNTAQKTNRAEAVKLDGSIYADGVDIVRDTIGVRPALWVTF